MSIEWHNIEIHPDTPSQGRSIRELFPAQTISGMYKSLNEMGGIYDLEFIEHDLLSNSRLSILVSEYIHLYYPAQEDTYHTSVFRAYFSEGKDIGQPKILADLLQEIGIDSTVLTKALNDPACQIRMKENALSAASMKVTGTPTFFIGNERIVGAQPYPNILAAARRALGLENTNQNDFPMTQN